LTSTETHGRSTLWELARLFLKLGTVAFGGPAAHIAMMEEEVVRRRAWLTRAEFLDYLGATIIPGPNSTELAAAGAVLDGVNIASFALMAVVTWQLARAAVVDLPTAAMALVSLILLLRFRVNSAWLVAGGALVGLLLPR
jgi:chromate transport protein ChrA